MKECIFIIVAVIEFLLDRQVLYYLVCNLENFTFVYVCILFQKLYSGNNEDTK